MNPLIMGLVVLMGAGDPWTDAASQDLTGYARALSLDLRGHVPTLTELESIELAGELPDNLNINIDNLKLMQGDYNVEVSNKLISRFTHTDRNIQYFIALEQK